jgi:hypothetical protein
VYVRAAALLAAAVAVAACRAAPPPTPTRPPPPTRVVTPAPTPEVIEVPGQPFPLLITRTPPEPREARQVAGVVVEPTPTAPPPGAAEARAQAEAALTGEAREDVLSMLRAAEGVGSEEERYQTYRGAWQFLRNEYFGAGEPPAQRAVLEAIHEVARGFPQYDPADFELRRP